MNGDSVKDMTIREVQVLILERMAAMDGKIDAGFARTEEKFSSGEERFDDHETRLRAQEARKCPVIPEIPKKMSPATIVGMIAGIISGMVGIILLVNYISGGLP